MGAECETGLDCQDTHHFGVSGKTPIGLIGLWSSPCKGAVVHKFTSYWLTFPSGSSTYPMMSVTAVLPNLPNAPCSLRPVKVWAIFQNLGIGNRALWVTGCFF